MMKTQRIKKRYTYALNRIIYSYRYDIFSISFMLLLILWYISPMIGQGHVVFGDIDIPADSRRYMEEIFGLWNQRWSTGSLENLPRLVYTFFPWLISVFAGFDGAVFFKSFLIIVLFSSAISQYLLVRKLIRAYHTESITFFHTLVLIPAGLLYALNPWVIYRIQHIYLLCGYSLFPLLLLFFLNTFDPCFLKQNIKGYSIFHSRLHKRNIFDAAMLALILSTMSAGLIYFLIGVSLLFLFLIILLVKTSIYYKRSGRGRIRAIFKSFLVKGLVFIAFFSIFSFHWFSIYLAGIISGNCPSLNVLDSLVLFSRNSSILNVAYLNSYWQSLFPLENLPVTFYVAGGIILAVIAIGIVYKAWKHTFLTFLATFYIFLVILSTGVKYSVTSDFYIFFATKIPVFGLIFKDPDILVGLLALSYSVLFVFGIVSLAKILSHNNWKELIFRASLSVVVVISFFLYLNPYREIYIKNFYSPVQIPEEYKDLNDRFAKEEYKGKALYIPTSDDMAQNHNDAATYFWNYKEGGREKPNGDFHVYNSLKNTVFHKEGSIPEISYYMKYLQYLMDWGLSTNILNYATVFSADEVIYHKEYKGQEARQDFNLAILDSQTGIEKKEESGIFTSYFPEKYPEDFRSIRNRIFTPYGLSHLEAFQSIGKLDWSDSAIIFTAQNKNSFFHLLRSGDMFEATSFNDIMLSSLDEKYYLDPSDFINDGNPFRGWSKTRLDTADWMWYLQSQGIDRNNFDFEPGSGMVVTFCSSKLDPPSYKIKKNKGDLIVDFNYFLGTGKFFTPDNPHLFSVQANPISSYNKFPAFQGMIQKEEPDDVGQVAKSGHLAVTGDNPYQFRISLSGGSVNKIHLKIHFYDEGLNELGTPNTFAPSRESTFDEVTLLGEYVSPPESKYMRIDLLSFKGIEQKTKWWIHDVQILDLKKYKARNTIKMTRFSEFNKDYYLFMRSFSSTKGGEISVSINNEEIQSIDTQSLENRLQWFDLGVVNLQEGVNLVEVENRRGFNAVNTLVLIPVNEFETLAFPFHRVSDRGIQFFTAEAESGFEYDGNIQSLRRYPALNSGDGIRSISGSLTKEFEIFQNGYYDFTIQSGRAADSGGVILMKLLDKNKEIVLEKEFLSGEMTGPPLITPEVVFSPLRNRDFPRRVNDDNYSFANYTPLVSENIPLTQGDYTLDISLESFSPSIASLNEIRLFDPSLIKNPTFMEDIFMENCSDCLQITPQMSSLAINDNILTINYEHTCSCDWYVYSTNKIRVGEGREYLIEFSAMSENVVDRHSKVLFLNKDDEIEDTVFIHGKERMYKEDYNRYEQIIAVPDGAVTMLFQVLCRGDKHDNGLFQMKDFSIVPLDDLLLIDSVVMREKPLLMADNKVNGTLMVSSESFNPLWKTNDERLIDRPIPVNSVNTAYYLKESPSNEFYIHFSWLYIGGVVVFPFGFLLLFLWIRKKSSNNG